MFSGTLHDAWVRVYVNTTASHWTSPYVCVYTTELHAEPPQPSQHTLHYTGKKSCRIGNQTPSEASAKITCLAFGLVITLHIYLNVHWPTLVSGRTYLLHRHVHTCKHVDVHAHTHTHTHVPCLHRCNVRGGGEVSALENVYPEEMLLTRMQTSASPLGRHEASSSTWHDSSA